MAAADEMPAMAQDVAGFLKGLAHPHRLLILCALMRGERSVTQLIAETGIAQTSMSQHLSKLKDEAIVTFRRDHRTLYYSICHAAVAELMAVLERHFCNTP
jgi:ArsR family transcriptional regulator, virulence genes transcriptional regulator